MQISRTFIDYYFPIPLVYIICVIPVNVNFGVMTVLQTWRSFWLLRSSNIGICCRNSFNILQTCKYLKLT